jgi:endonuclease YncB( thermonuclease family)
MKTLKSAVISTLLFASVSLAAELPTYQVRTERVTDSQSATFVITSLRRPEKIKVRLAGINVHPSKQASAFLENLLVNRALGLTITGQQKDGTFDGVLSYWIADQKLFVNSELVKAGYATLVPLDADVPEEIAASLNDAVSGAKRLAGE